MTTLISEEAAKAKARALQAGAAEMQIPLTRAQSLELIARTEGMPNWSTLNARQRRAETEARRQSKTPSPSQAVPFIVGTDNLLPGHKLVDDVPCSMFGDTRKNCLYDAMRVMGVPAIYWHPVVEMVQEQGGFSEPASRRLCDDEESRYEDDLQPCNRFGQTRLQVLQAALDQTRLMGREVVGLIDEYRARGGLRPSWSAQNAQGGRPA